MKNYLRPVLMATLIAAAFSVQAQYSQYSGGSNYTSGYSTSCESGDETRRASSLQVVGLTRDQRLICFNENRPGDARDIGPVTGLYANEVLIGIDYRVQNKVLYGVSSLGRIFTLDTMNGKATQVNQLSVKLEGDFFGVDFNPAADRLRIVSNTGQNLRHDVNLAAPTTVVDDPLDYPIPTAVNSVGPNALNVTGSAYTNNDLDASTATTLYALDTRNDQISIQSPPNDGTLAATGKMGVDASAVSGFDIYSTVRNGVTINVQALAALETLATNTNAFYSINLPTGKATSRGNFSSRNKVIGIAIPLNQL